MAPKVSIIIQTWDPKLKRYLDLCVRSVRNLNYPQDKLEVIIVGKPSYLPQYDGVRTLDFGCEQYYASEGYNLGYATASPDSKYIFSLNDDVCLTRDSLAELVAIAETCDNPLIALNGTSPSDRGCTCFLNFSVQHEGTEYKLSGQNYRYEDTEPLHNAMLNARSQYPFGVILSPFLCMYATLFSRALYEKIGGFDRGFKGGPDDIDFCLRAKEAGGVIMMALHVVIWHFGSVTIETSYPAERWLYNTDYFRSKWGRLPDLVTEERYRLAQLTAKNVKTP